MMAFLLIIIGVILIFINVKAIKKDKGSFSEALKGSIENIDEYKEEIGLIRKEFAETLIDIQKEMEYLKKELNILQYKYEYSMEEDNFYKENHSASYGKENYKDSLELKYMNNGNDGNTFNKINEKIMANKNDLKNDNSIKVDEVSKLIKEGKTTEEICEILNIGKGEVILIKELYLK